MVAIAISAAALAVESPHWSLLMVMAAGMGLGIFIMVLRGRHTLLGQEVGFIGYVGACGVAVGMLLVTFNAVRVSAHVTASDLFFLASACLFFASLFTERARLPSIPGWLLLSVAGILSAGVLAATNSTNVGADLVATSQFCVALLGIPVVLAFATGASGKVIVMSKLWLVSAGVNAAVGVLDYLHVTNIGPAIAGAVFAGRTTGLTVQPNHLGLAGAMAVPVGLFLATRSQRKIDCFAWAGVTALISLGVLVSGSRAAVVAAAAGGLLFPVLGHRLWRQTLLVLAVSAAIIVMLSLSLSDQTVPFVNRFAAIQRLTNGAADTASSDSSRLEYYGLALADFSKNPLTGNGLDLVRDAHDIYFQLLQAGGVIALISFVLFAGASVRLGWRLSRQPTITSDLQNLASGLTASICVWMLAGLVQNLIYDRFLYVPIGLLIGMRALAR